MNRPTAIAIAGAVLIGIALYGLGRWDAAVSQRGSEAISAAKAWLAAGNARRAERSRLLAAAQRAGARADQLAAAARSHARSDSTLNAALDRAATAADSLPIVVAQRDTARAAAVSWAQAFAALTLKDIADSTSAARGWAAADSAERLIPPVLAIADCHWLAVRWLPKCLSRTTSLIVGGVGGAIAVLATRR